MEFLIKVTVKECIIHISFVSYSLCVGWNIVYINVHACVFVVCGMLWLTTTSPPLCPAGMTPPQKHWMATSQIKR